MQNGEMSENPQQKEEPVATQTALNFLQEIISNLPVGKELPDGSIVDIIVHPNLLTVKQKIELSNLIVSELRSAGKNIPADLNELVVAYHSFLKEVSTNSNASQPLVNATSGKIQAELFDQTQDKPFDKTQDKQLKTESNIDFKSLYLLNQRLVELKKKRFDRTITALEEAELIQRIKERFSDQGVTVNEPITVDELLKAHSVLRQRENEDMRARPENDYLDFCEKNPSLIVRDIKMNALPQEKVVLSNQSFEIQHQMGVDTRVSLIFIPDGAKEDDAMGISQTIDGKVNLVIADGVSGSALPRFASRNSREVALEILENGSPSTNVLKAAYDALQNRDLTAMALVEEQRLRDTIRASTEESDKITYNNWLENKKELREKNKIAQTTMIAAQYDRKNDRLAFALRGDSSLVVFRKNMPAKRYLDPTNKQVVYDVQPKAQYQSYGEIVGSLELADDDVILICSDGSDDEHLPNIFDELNVVIERARNSNSGERLDIVVTNYMKTKLKENGIADDISILALHHETLNIS